MQLKDGLDTILSLELLTSQLGERELVKMQVNLLLGFHTHYSEIVNSVQKTEKLYRGNDIWTNI